MNSQYYYQANTNNTFTGNYRLPLIETQRVFQDNKRTSSASAACIQFGPDTIVEIGSPIYLCDQDSRSNASSLNKASKKIAKNYPVVQESPKKVSTRRHNKVRNPWTPKEDLKLMDLMKKYGQSWAMISSLMDGRTGKQVRDRYLNKLRPNIRCGDWSQREDDLLISLCKEIGNRWSLIATHLPGRTEAQVKNRYYSSIKKRIEDNGVYNPIFNSKTNSDKATSFESSPVEENGFDLDCELDFDSFNCEANQAAFDNTVKVSYATEEESYSENTATSPQNSSECTYEINNEIPFDNEEALVFARNSSFLFPSVNLNEVNNTYNAQPEVDSFFAPENVIFQRGNSVFPVQEEQNNEKWEQLNKKKTYLEMALARTLQEISSL